MQRETNSTGLVGSLVLVAFIALFAGGLIWVFFKALASLESATSAAVVTASTTALVAVASVLLSRRAEQRRQIEQELRSKKSPLYAEFTRAWWDVFQTAADSDPDEELTPEQLAPFLKASQEFLLWAPAEVIAAYNEFRRIGATGDAGPEVIFAFERLVFAFRRDLGHDDTNLGKGDLLRIFVTDVDESLMTE